MRGRPPLPLGTWGNITTRKLDTGWQADTRLRLYTGKTVRVRATGKTKTAAITNVKQRCAQRLNTTSTETLTPTSTLNSLIETWMESKADVTQQTKDRYKTAHNNTIRDGIGEIRLNELTPAIMHKWSQATPAGTSSNARSVLKGALGMAVVFGLIPNSPLDHIARKKTAKKPVDALTVEQIPIFRTHIHDYAKTLSNKHTADLLRDVTDFALSTGMRLGEILAIRWQDINSNHLHVTGTIVFNKQHGNIRQDKPKTETSNRVIQLGTKAQEIINRRKGEDWADHADMLFPSVRLTYMETNNFNRLFRKAKGDEWAWVTIHTLRRTVATIINSELGSREASDLLGHSDMGLTQRVYVARNDAGVEIGMVIDRILADV